MSAMHLAASVAVGADEAPMMCGVGLGVVGQKATKAKVYIALDGEAWVRGPQQRGRLANAA
eukprot:scaffold7072_cov167-Cylindrotheca_fusiformis.AAC.2